MSLKALVRTILHAKQPMIVWWGPDLIQLYNDAMLDSMRDKHPLGMGQPGREAWKGVWATVGDELQSVVDSGASFWKEGVLVPVDRNGRVEDAWWTYSYSPVFDDDGRPGGVLIICTETTSGIVARHQLERATREAERAREELREAFLQAPSPIALLSGDEHVFVLANTAYERLVSRPVVGKSLDDAFTPEEIALYRPLIEQVYRTGTPQDLRGAEMRLPNGAGVEAVRYIDVGYHPYRNVDSEVTGVIVFVNDVTEVVTRRIAAERLETERAQLLEEETKLRATAEATGRLKDEFIATVSHELRTPLMAMIGWVQLLRSGQLSDARRKYALETVERNARAQSALVEDLLDIGRIGTGTLRLAMETVLLAPIVEAAVETLRSAAHAAGVHLHVALDTDGRLRGDARRLEQIATNLLSNAVKFTPRGGLVSVSLRPTGASVELVVNDNGSGIEASFLPHVFEKFRQADAAMTRAHGGLGLGLAIVRQLVELHGGSVHAESGGACQGATFCVRLPVLTGEGR